MYGSRIVCYDDRSLSMGYRTPNEEAHDCVYCDSIVSEGEGVLLKYSQSQADEDITVRHLSNKVGHLKCIEVHGTYIEKEALIVFK